MTPKPGVQVPPPEFAAQVRSALMHLFDLSNLQTHPLADRFSRHAAASTMRGKLLRRQLLDAIEVLRPDARRAADSRAASIHRILEMRYIEGLALSEVTEQLGLSKSEYYRRHGLALEAIISHLWDQWQTQDGEQREHAKGEPAEREELARLEIEQIRDHTASSLIDLAEVLASVVATLQPLSEQKQAPIKLSMPTGQTPLRLNRVMARQALMSVLTRALDLAAGAEVGVSAERCPESVRVVITATAGRAEGLSSISRSDRDLETSGKLVEALGGTLSFEVLKASAWSLVLTLAPARWPVVLVVDNSPGFAELVARYLRPYGWETMGARDVEQGLARARELGPSVILLDVLMPDRDGWELLSGLKADERTRDVPVLVCSVLYEPQLASSLGAVGWLPKPVTRLSLLQALQPWHPGRHVEDPRN